MPEKISSRNVSPDGQNSSPRMKFNSQTTPLTTFSLSLTTYHVAQTHTFRLVAPMEVLTNLLIGTEHKRWGLEAFHKRKKKGWGDKRTENSDKIDFISLCCLSVRVERIIIKKRNTYNCFKRIYCCFAIHFCRFE